MQKINPSKFDPDNQNDIDHLFMYIEHYTEKELEIIYNIIDTSIKQKSGQIFLSYNVEDTTIVDELEDKCGFIALVVTAAYEAKCNFSDMFATVKPWDVVIHNYLMDRNKVIPFFKKSKLEKKIMGGFVLEPEIGMHNWLVSTDFTSLYPKIIEMYNISPETFMGQFQILSVEDIINGKFVPHEKYATTANGCRFRKDEKGFLPELMSKFFSNRAAYKDKMLDAEKEYEETKNPETKKLISKFHNLQLSVKIFLNSLYGALANIYNRWFSVQLAEGITSTGQLHLKYSIKKINEFLNKRFSTKNKSYVPYGDTDSCYINVENLLKDFDTSDRKATVEYIDTFCKKELQPYLNDCFVELKDMMNAYEQTMDMKREMICDKALFKTGKYYILSILSKEKVTYSTPKLKVTGLQSQRSNVPANCRAKLKECYQLIFTGKEEDLQKVVKDFKEKFLTLPFEQISKPTGINNMKTYETNGLDFVKHTPIHVKGAMIFNRFLKKKDIKDIRPIVDGDKIRIAYLKLPNPTFEHVIGCPDTLPEGFDLDKYLDRDKQFEANFLLPIQSIAEVVGWQAEKKASIRGFLR